jgi:uncharacterized protein (DUF1015 family)
MLILAVNFKNQKSWFVNRKSGGNSNFDNKRPTLTKILPFRAIRPTRDKAHLVATMPYYTYKKNVLLAKMESNPYTFLHVINPELHETEKSAPNSDERFLKTKNKLAEFIREGIFVREKKDSLYLYRQTKDGHVYLGLIGGASVDQYNTGHIKKHEETITAREEIFSRYLQITEFNAEPVLLFHEENQDLNNILDAVSKDRPEYEYTSTERIKHEVWIIDSPETISKIQACYREIADVYIADGHHRCASSAHFTNHLGPEKTEIQQHFLAYFISERRLFIMDYNRLVKDLNGLSIEEFLSKVSTRFKIHRLQAEDDERPTRFHEISMYLDKTWYKLIPNAGSYDENDSVRSLDTAILSENLLLPVLGISDLKTDYRIDFISGNKGLEAIEKCVDSDQAKVGFALYPVSVEQLKRVADENKIMPPKSTWIEPKLRSGLTIYPLI